MRESREAQMRPLLVYTSLDSSSVGLTNIPLSPHLRDDVLRCFCSGNIPCVSLAGWSEGIRVETHFLL